MPPKLPSSLSFDTVVPLTEGLVTPYIQDWLAATQGGDRETAAGTRGRASNAGRCSREMAFQILDFERDIVIPPEVLMAFSVGNAYHAVIQEIMTEHLDAKAEVTSDWRPEYDVSGHADALWHVKSMDLDAITEIKTVSGYGFAIAIGERYTDEGAGPKMEHVVQAALSAAAPNINAQLVHMLYIDKDRQRIAEWLIDMDQPFPQWGGTPRELVMAELQRFTGVLKRIDDGLLPARWIPGFGPVAEPPHRDSPRGTEPWNCRYCGYQPTCAELPTGPVSIESIRKGGADV